MRFVLPLAAMTLFALAGCATGFGEYEVRNAELVRGLPSGVSDTRAGENFARVALVSDFDVTTGTDALYVSADLCPYVRKPAFGADGRHLPTANLVGYGPFDAAGSELDRSRPARADDDGRFRYFVYLPVESAAWRERLAGQDEVCVVITHPTYPRERVSEPFRVMLPEAS